MTGVKPPRFDTTINYGHLLQTFVLLVTIGGFVYKYATFETEVRASIAASSERARVYAPLVQELARSNGIQDERIGTLSSAVQDIRKTNSEVLVQLGAVREELAGIKAKIR